MTHTTPQSPFACVMDDLTASERDQHLANAKILFERVAQTSELGDGYAFRFGDDPDVFLRLVEFVKMEKICCPFFGFAIKVEPETGNVSLELTGRDGVKSFIQAEISEILGTTILN